MDSGSGSGKSPSSGLPWPAIIGGIVVIAIIVVIGYFAAFRKQTISMTVVEKRFNSHHYVR